MVRSTWGPFAGVLIAVLIGGLDSQIAHGEYLSCPDQPEVTCVPGKVGGRVVCAGKLGILEYENVTAFCLSCHEPESSGKSQAKSSASSRGMQWGHPMEVEYPERRRGFVARSELFEALELTGESVTCETCHGGSSKANHYISAHPRQPNLCTHCHRK